MLTQIVCCCQLSLDCSAKHTPWLVVASSWLPVAGLFNQWENFVAHSCSVCLTYGVVCRRTSRQDTLWPQDFTNPKGWPHADFAGWIMDFSKICHSSIANILLHHKDHLNPSCYCIDFKAYAYHLEVMHIYNITPTHTLTKLLHFLQWAMFRFIEWVSTLVCTSTFVGATLFLLNAATSRSTLLFALTYNCLFFLSFFIDSFFFGFIKFPVDML